MNYKETNIDFIGAIPEHWSLVPVKYLSSFRMGQTILKEDLIDDGKFPVYSATEKDSYFGYIDNPLFTLEKGDIVIPARGNSIGHVKLVNEKSVSTQTTIANLIDQEKVSSKFLYYFYKAFKVNLFPYDNTAIPQITVEKIRENIITLPPIIEQSQIADFLDQKTAQIDTIIEKKQKLLQLLEEKKKSVINEAVTKGLNSGVPMKVVNEDWIESIPTHWKNLKLKWISEIYAGGTPSTLVEEYWKNGNIPWLNSGTVNQRIINTCSNFITKLGFDNSSAKWIPKKSLLIALAGQGKTRGTVAKLEIEATCNQSLGVIVPYASEIDYEFLFYWLDRNYLNIRSLSGLDTRDGLNLQMVGNFPIPLPPLEEQKAISHFLSLKEIHFNEISEKIELQISKLQEYRQSIISEAVTGKITV